MNFQIIGGDERQHYLADFLKKKGFSVQKKIEERDPDPRQDADYLILPLPASRDGRSVFMPHCSHSYDLKYLAETFRGKRIFGGMLPKFSAPCPITDYYCSDSLLWANAALTAEGAIGLAIGAAPFSLWEATCIVLGAGRIGQLLAKRLQAMGAQVLVGARREEPLALLRAAGIEGRRIEDLPFGQADILFNTAPARILKEEQLNRFKKGAILIELASSPGGYDPEEAAAMGLISIGGQGLPGRFSPKTAARLIGETILKEMENDV